MHYHSNTAIMHGSRIESSHVYLIAATSVNDQGYQPIGKLGLEPGGLRRHHLAGVGNSHQVFHLRWVHREGDRHFAAVDPLFKCLQAANTTDKIYAAVTPGIVNPKQWRKQVISQHAYIQPTNRVGRYMFRGDRQDIPLPGQIHPETARSRRTYRYCGWTDTKALADAGEKDLRALTAKIPDDAVVVKNKHLVMRKYNGQEYAGITLNASLCRNPGSRCRAMVSIGNIEGRHGIEAPGNVIEQARILHNPETVSNAVVRNKINIGGTGSNLCKDGIDSRIRFAGQQHRACLGIQRLDLPDTVVLLVRPGKFMAADAIGVVGMNRSGSDQAGLRVFTHAQTVDVITGLRVTYEHALLEHASKIIRRALIDRGIVLASARREIDFRPGNMQETPRTTSCALTRFVTVEHVIGWRNNLIGTATGWTQAAKRTYQGHVNVTGLNRKTILYMLASGTSTTGGAE